jgi:hypothetical protein
MANTFIKISSGTIVSSATSYTISSIPSTYSVLKLYLVTQCNPNSVNLLIRLNGITTAGSYAYNQRYDNSNPTTAVEFTTASSINLYNVAGGSGSGAFAPCEITIPNAKTQTGGFGSGLMWQGGAGIRASGLIYESYGFASNTSIINTSISSITVTAGAGQNIGLNSTWQLYGLE